MGRLLGLKASEILIADSVSEPVVAYRRRSNSKPEKADALAMGKALENLVDYLPFNKYQSPPGLINPRNTTEYIESAANGIRGTLDGEGFVIEVDNLIRNCQGLKIVLVPVLWGEKDLKYNALSIYLPTSGTNWVFLNLDLKPMDFKFWILHEMVHSMARGAFPNSETEESFCDNLASAILVPIEFAEKILAQTMDAVGRGDKFLPLLNAAKLLAVSPITLAKRVDAIARAKHATLLFGDEIFAVCEKFNKESGLVNETYFESFPPSAEELIQISQTRFNTPVYQALGAYIRETDASEGAVSAMLGLSPIDAKSVYHALLET